MSAYDELLARRDACRATILGIDNHIREIQASFDEQMNASQDNKLVKIAALDEIEFAIDAIEKERASAPAEIAVAQGSYAAVLPPAPKPRAPKRDLRALVMQVVGKHKASDVLNAKSIAGEIGGISTAQAQAAIDHNVAAGKLRIGNLGDVHLAPSPAPIEKTAAEVAEVPEPVSEPEQARPAETAPQSDRERLVAYLSANGSRLMAEIMQAGIPAAEVYRAQRDGTVVEVDRGMFALAERDAQAEAAE